MYVFFSIYIWAILSHLIICAVQQRSPRELLYPDENRDVGGLFHIARLCHQIVLSKLFSKLCISAHNHVCFLCKCGQEWNCSCIKMHANTLKFEFIGWICWDLVFWCRTAWDNTLRNFFKKEYLKIKPLCSVKTARFTAVFWNDLTVNTRFKITTDSFEQNGSAALPGCVNYCKFLLSTE